MKLGELVGSVAALSSLSEKKMKAKLAYRISRIMLEANSHLTSFQEARDKIVEKYGTKNDEGETVVKPNSKNWKKFSEELDALLDEEVKLKFDQLKLKEIGNLEVSVGDMLSLNWLIKD
tara:strand:+ start:466 stop:822 length:357 start_codon:yes stop_codon:yes gene_type:complete